MSKSLASIIILFFFHNCLVIMFNGPVGGLKQVTSIPAATIVRSEDYKVLEKSSGETSVFYPLGLFPLTNPLNIEYAMSQAVQKVAGGDSLTNVIITHEVHYYFPLGTVSVLKVEGDVVSFAVKEKSDQIFKDKKGKEIKSENNEGGIKIGGKKKPPQEGGITVGGK